MIRNREIKVRITRISQKKAISRSNPKKIKMIRDSRSSLKKTRTSRKNPEKIKKARVNLNNHFKLSLNHPSI